ncbi:MAG TPA: type II 3-dehydroquinate dehydratase [Burkholderiales bacterium]|nr:type II 3-dehydroquinate dehydratase [Burkholderiales bacterium]
MAKVLVVHGKGMEMRGKEKIEIFGTMTLPEYDEHIRRYAKELGIDVEIFHSNVESEVVAKIGAAKESVDAIVINPAGYTTGHPALAAALAEVHAPTVEVHVSNPARRGGVSEIARVTRSALAGYGVFGYYLALRGTVELLKS